MALKQFVLFFLVGQILYTSVKSDNPTILAPTASTTLASTSTDHNNDMDHSGHHEMPTPKKDSEPTEEHLKLDRAFKDAMKELNSKIVDCDKDFKKIKDQFDTALGKHDHPTAKKLLEQAKVFKSKSADPCKPEPKVQTNGVESIQQRNWHVIILSAVVAFAVKYV